MRRFLASLAATIAFFTVPGSASATTIGETFHGASACTPDYVYAQTTSPAGPGQYAVPFDGVITRWDYQAGAAVGQLRFKTFRALAPQLSSSIVVTGQSAEENPVANTLNRFLTRVPVEANDYIGFYVGSGTGACSRGGGALPNYRTHYYAGDVAPGVIHEYNSAPGHQLNVSAELEPDADGDGYGDETQDGCPTDTSTQGPCPGEPGQPGAPGAGALTLELQAKKQKLRKKVKFFATASANSTLVAKGKKTKKKTEELAADQRTKVKAKVKRKKKKRLEKRVDKRGKAKVKIRGTVKTQSGAEASDKVKVKVKG